MLIHSYKVIIIPLQELLSFFTQYEFLIKLSIFKILELVLKIINDNKLFQMKSMN